MFRRLALAAAAALFATGVSAHDGPGTHGPSGHLDDRSLPSCEASKVLADITKKAAFPLQEPYQHAVAITGYDHIRQTRHIGSTGAGLRERRWCQARAHLETGHARTVYYLIESHASFVGVSYGIESCISGRDLWNVHGGDCSALRVW